MGVSQVSLPRIIMSDVFFNCIRLTLSYFHLRNRSLVKDYAWADFHLTCALLGNMPDRSISLDTSFTWSPFHLKQQLIHLFFSAAQLFIMLETEALGRMDTAVDAAPPAKAFVFVSGQSHRCCFGFNVSLLCGMHLGGICTQDTACCQKGTTSEHDQGWMLKGARNSFDSFDCFPLEICSPDLYSVHSQFDCFCNACVVWFLIYVHLLCIHLTSHLAIFTWTIFTGAIFTWAIITWAIFTWNLLKLNFIDVAMVMLLPLIYLFTWPVSISPSLWHHLDAMLLYFHLICIHLM